MPWNAGVIGGLWIAGLREGGGTIGSLLIAWLGVEFHCTVCGGEPLRIMLRLFYGAGIWKVARRTDRGYLQRAAH